MKGALHKQSLHLQEDDSPAIIMNIALTEVSVRWRSNSVILRLASPADPFAEVLEVEWTPGFFFRFDAPLRMLGSVGHGGTLGGLDLSAFSLRTRQALEGIRAVGSQSYDHDRLNQLQLFDGRELMLQFGVFFETFRQVVGERLWTGKALQAVRGSGLADGAAVLVDCDEWAAHVQRHGLPLADFPAEVTADRVLVAEVGRLSWLAAAGTAGLRLGLGQEATAKIFSACLIGTAGTDIA